MPEDIATLGRLKVSIRDDLLLMLLTFASRADAFGAERTEFAIADKQLGYDVSTKTYLCLGIDQLLPSLAH